MGTNISPRVLSVRALGVGLAASGGMIFAMFASAAAFAGDLGSADSHSFKDPAPDDDFLTRPYLFGDWGGTRTRLRGMGIDVTFSGVNETVGNVSGGRKNIIQQASQFALGAKFDMDKLAGWQGGTFNITLSDRFGHSHAEDAHIPALQLDNEVFGRGNIVRLTELYYQQKLFGDQVQIKGGRLPVASDFFFQHCDFLNLSLCGGQPGNLLGDYIYNWPVSQWAGIVKFNLPQDFAFQVGVYDRNDKYLDTRPDIALLPSWPSDSQGALVPLELQWKPRIGNLQPGDWRVGGWFSTEDAQDVAKDINGDPFLVTQLPAVIDSGRSGFYFSFLQPLTSDPTGADPKYGLSVFVNGSFGDQETSFLDRQISIGLIQHATFPWRPNDEIAFGYSQTHVNSRVADAEAAAGLATQDTEHVFEVWYGIQATGWLNIHLDAQWIHNPGGFSESENPDADDAVVLGAKTSVQF